MRLVVVCVFNCKGECNMILYEQIDKKKSRILKRFSKYAVHDAPFLQSFALL